MKVNHPTPEHRRRRLALAERQRNRAAADARHAILWLTLDKGPGSPKEPGDVTWSYDLNEALILLRAATKAVEDALEGA